MRRAILAIVMVALAGGIFALKSGVRRTAAAAVDDPIGDYERTCTGADTLDCDILGARVRARVLLALDELVYARDVRSADAALAALELDDPEIQHAALRVLERLPPQPGAERALPLLLSEHFVLRRAAARLLERAGGDAARIAQHAASRNGTLSWPSQATATDVDPPPPDVKGIGFTVDPSWRRYPAADARSAVGYASKEPLETVVAAVQRATGVAPLDPAGLQAFQQSYMNEGLGAAPRPDDAQLKELEGLIQEYTKKQDPSVMAKIEALQKKMEARMSALQADLDPGALDTRPPQLDPKGKNLRAFIAEKRGRKPVRVVYVYREEALGLTAVELVWDPKVLAVRGGH